MAPRFCLIDFETSSACDLKKSGAARYAEDPTTEILCLGYSVDGATPVVLAGYQIVWGADPVLAAAVLNPEVMFIAHNAGFEKGIWRNLMVLLGWPDIPNERYHDVMAACAMKGLPLKLEKAAAALELAVQKDTEGTKATLALGRTNKAGSYTRTPEKLQRVYDYNRTDVLAELEAHRVVQGLGPAERRVWLLDQKINERGVRLDLPFISAAQQICDDATRPLLKEFQTLTGIDKVGSPKFLEWLHKHGAPLPNLQKETVNKFLGEADDEDEQSLAGEDEDYQPEETQLTLPFAYRRPLQIRKVLGSASIKKLAAMQACVCSDGRAHGLLQYHGAGTGRWAGRLLQPQNFPRPTLKVQIGWNADGTEKWAGHDPESLVAAVLTRDHEYVRMLFGEPIEAIASGLRHALVPAPGCLFEIGDFSKIECVIVLALAGARDTAAQVIKAGSAVYTNMASKVYKRPITKQMLKEYTIGKNIVLGCFGGETPVLTNRGAIRLDEVSTDDMLWDGVEWVNHGGLLCQGLQKTICLSGVEVTPEHEVLVGRTWCPARSLARNGNILSRALATALESLPSGLTWSAQEAESPTSTYFAPAEPGHTELHEATCAGKNPLGVTRAQKIKQPARERNGGDIPPFARTTRTGEGFLTACLQFLTAAKMLVTGAMPATAAGALGYGRSGERTARSFFGTCLLWTGGTSQNWNSTEKIMIRDTSQEISGSSPGHSISQTEEQSSFSNSASKSLRPVFDIAYAGPRSRFTILTDSGPLVVHNCGFQMGWKKFKNRYAEDSPDEFAQSAVSQYREVFAPEVPKLWRALEDAAVRTVWDRTPHEAYGVLYALEGRWLTARLPSGRKLWYYGPQPVRKRMPWSTEEEPDIRRGFEYSAWKMGQWKRVSAYGGLLTENVVQALARDLLVHGMFNLEAAGHPLVLTVHDEAIAEVPEPMADAKLMDTLLTDCPSWAKAMGIPVASECHVAGRYAK